MQSWLEAPMRRFWRSLGSVKGKDIAAWPMDYEMEQMDITFASYCAAGEAGSEAAELSIADMWDVLHTTLKAGKVGLVLEVPEDKVEVLGTTVG